MSSRGRVARSVLDIGMSSYARGTHGTDAAAVKLPPRQRWDTLTQPPSVESVARLAATTAVGHYWEGPPCHATQETSHPHRRTAPSHQETSTRTSRRCPP